jgi:hypothetical protein
MLLLVQTLLMLRCSTAKTAAPTETDIALKAAAGVFDAGAKPASD